MERVAEATNQAEHLAVLGAGSWGTALAVVLAANGHRVRLWARDPVLTQHLATQRENTRYLPDIALSPAIAPTSDLREAVQGARFVLIAVPGEAVRAVAQAAAPFLEPDTALISASKGLEPATGLRLSQTLEEVLPGCSARLTVLSGPNLAMEMARFAPTASVAASVSPDAARSVQRLFHRHSSVRIYTGSDVAGVEIGGAIKNVIALCAGVSDGLGYGDNTRAALVTRGLAEAVRLGLAEGARPLTFLGLSGVGDLVATCGSRLSRNYRAGLALAEGRALPEIRATLGQAAEGIPTTHAVYSLALRHGVEMPLSSALYSILFLGSNPADVIRELMIRPLRAEGPDASSEWG